MIFIANWICRSGTVVLTKRPAVPGVVGVEARDNPVASKMSVLPSPGPGGAKLGWLRILNISTRNCTLKFSEILLIWLFLNTEKSKPVTPGPINMLRPEFPRRLKHARGESGGAIGLPKLRGTGSRVVSQK